MGNAQRLLGTSLLLGAAGLLSACAGPGPYYADYGPGYGYDYAYGPGYYDYGPAVGFDVFRNGHRDRDFHRDEHNNRHAFIASHSAPVASARSVEPQRFSPSVGGGRESGERRDNR